MNAYDEGQPHGFHDVPREKIAEIEEPSARAMLEAMRSWEVEIPEQLASEARVRVTGVGPRNGLLKPRTDPPVVLLHGFDSNCLEYRRLHPLLDERLDTFAIDILGWGFSQLNGVSSFSAEAKREYLYAFWRDVLKGRPMVLVGASLGGAAAIDFAATHPEAVAKLVLIDAQAYIDGLGPMASLPVPIARLGIQVLKSEPLRAYAGKLSYADPETYSTRDAMNIGRIHTLRDGWEDASVNYMLSGGFSTSSKVSVIRAPSLVLWGREDQILDTRKFAGKFLDDMLAAQLKIIDGSGHVPHLERPRETAEAILAFVEGRQVGDTSLAFLEEVEQPQQLNLWQSFMQSATSGIRAARGRRRRRQQEQAREACDDCQGDEVVGCPNCDAQGTYVTYGRLVECKCCKGTGLVICRACFNGDPYDMEGIREKVQRAAMLRRRTVDQA